MGRHRGARRRAWRAGAPISLAAVAVALLVLGSEGTYAYWNDQGTVTTGSFVSGTIDLTVGSTVGDQLAGPGGTWVYASLAMSNMVPGSTISRPLTLMNAGTADVTYTGTVSAASSVLTGASADTGLSVVLRDGADASCVGGSALPAVLPSTVASTFASAVPLAAGATHRYCVTVTLGTNAPSSMQGLSTELTLAFVATQVAP